MADKKISYFMKLLEVAIQAVTFLSAATAIYFGALGKPDSDFWKCIIIIVLVVLAYLSRMKIHRFGFFMAVHVFIMVSAFFMGANDGERFFYFIICGLIAGYSIRLKLITVQRSDVSGIPMQDNSTGEDIAETLEMKKNLMASEQIPFSFCAFMIIGYMAGHAANRDIIMNTEVILFILFVLLQVIYNDLKKLNTVFLTNQKKQQFPKEQLKRVNTFIIAATLALMFFGMLLFYHGEYGNIFNMIGAGAMSIVRFLLKILLAVWGSGSADEGTAWEETTTAAEEDLLDGMEEPYVPSAAASAAAEVFGIILMIAAVLGVAYAIFAYARNFNRKGKKDADDVEEIISIAKQEKKTPVRHQKARNQVVVSENEAVRKVYKKSVLKGTKKKKPDDTLVPKDLTRQTITDDEQLSEQITQLYEKARYSKEAVTKEETKHFKEIIKHDLTS